MSKEVKHTTVTDTTMVSGVNVQHKYDFNSKYIDILFLKSPKEKGMIDMTVSGEGWTTKTL